MILERLPDFAVSEPRRDVDDNGSKYGLSSAARYRVA
jgi:hypothetical protein